MRNSTIGTLLAIYGICGGLFETFISYAAYVGGPQGAFIEFIFLLSNPLILLYRPSVLTILVIGVYPFAMIAIGLYLIVSYKKKSRR